MQTTGVWRAVASRKAVVARRGDQDAVDLARQERTDSLAFVAFVLRRVDQDDFVALRPRFVDDDAGDMGEIGVVDAGDQQTERVGTAGAQPFGQQAGRVVGSVRPRSAMSATVFSLIRYLAACPLSTRETVETEKPVRCAMLMRVSFDIGGSISRQS